MSVEISQRTERNVFYDSILNQPISKTTTNYQTTIILNILNFHNVNPVFVIKSLFIAIIFIYFPIYWTYFSNINYTFQYIYIPIYWPIKTLSINNLILFDTLKFVTVYALLNTTISKRLSPRLQSIKFIFQFFANKADLLRASELIIHFGVVLVLEWKN